MENLIIDNWNRVDAISFYTYQSIHNPLVYSKQHSMWVANSYACCKSILSSEYARVPRPGIPESGTLNEEALLMLNNLARISNGDQHYHARMAVRLLYDCIKAVSIGPIMDSLLATVNNHAEFDWVAVIGKQLPVVSILKGLSFSDEDCGWVVKNMPALIKIMLPQKTKQDIEDINEVIPRYYQLSSRYIHKHTITDQLLKCDATISRSEASGLLICNLLGLFIQSYDACRALLTIAATTLARLKTERVSIKADNAFFQKLIDELLRIDPPVHNTRRIASHDLQVDDKVIKEGDAILVVLGAANMDYMVFDSPERFDIERGNNSAHLTFGLGGHACIAKHFCRDMAVQTSRYIVDRFGEINIHQQNISYESQLNVKMAKRLMVGL